MYNDDILNRTRPGSIALPCGGIARFDHESGISYRCTTCFMVVGSMGMPKRCKELLDADKS